MTKYKDPDDRLAVSIPLESGDLAQFRYYPGRLTATDAERIAAVIRALVIPKEQPNE